MCNLRYLTPALFALSVTAFFIGCTQNDGNIGSGINDPGFTGTVVDTALYPDFLNSYYSVQYNSGQGLYLYLGENNGFQTKFLLKFTSFSALPDSFRIDSAFINIKCSGIIGDSDAVYPDFTASIYRPTDLLPTDDWNESSVTWDSVLAWDESVSYFDFTVPADADTDSLYFDVDTSVVNQWIYADTLNPNTGFIFNYTSSPQFIKKFFSSESADTLLRPTLYLYYTPFDSSSGDTAWIAQTPDTLKTYASQDVYIARDNASLANNRLYIGRSQAYRSLFYYDLSDYFPQFGVYINKMEFVAFIDSDNPLYFGETTTVTNSQISNNAWMSDPTAVEFASYYGTSSAIAADSLVVNITTLARTWTAYPDSNFGFAVRFSSEGQYLARIPIYTPSDPDLTKRPYIHVIYSGMDQ